MKPKTALIYSEKFLEHKTGMHCENPARLKIALEALKNFGLLSEDKCIIVEPREATVEELELVHDRSYIEEIKRFCLSGGGYYDGDTRLSKESYDVASYAVGGMLKICELIFKGEYQNAFGLLRPPGHHAGIFGRAMGASSVGFCVFNNVAVTTAFTLKKQLAKKVLIFDFDVHHGNGIQEIFNSSPQVLYVSFHERGIYPGTGYENQLGEGEGRGYKVNVPLPHGSDDTAYLKALEEVVLPVAEEFKPDLVLLSAGFDAHHSDMISSINISAECYRKMTEAMVKLSKKHCNGRLIGFLEGGYSPETLSKSFPTTIAALTETVLPIEDKKTSASSSIRSRAEETVRNLRNILSKYWKL